MPQKPKPKPRPKPRIGYEYLFMSLLLLLACSPKPPTKAPPSGGGTIGTISTAPGMVSWTPVKLQRDTIFVHDTVTQVVTQVIDSSKWDIVIHPLSGDNTPQWQKAVDFCIRNPGYRIKPDPGVYQNYSPVLGIWVKDDSSDYNQVSFDIIGPKSCKASPDPGQAIIQKRFDDGPTFIIQRGKGVNIINIGSKGMFTFPSTISILQLQTLKFAEWDDGHTRQNRWSPECFAAVDPFCDSTYMYSPNDMYPKLHRFYIPGMARAGSTGIRFIGCRMMFHVVGVVWEPSFQQNGDVSDVMDCKMEYNKVNLAYTQDQAKQNRVQGLMDWGMTHTVIDTYNYGKGGGVLPDIDGMNLAGGIYQVMKCNGANFVGHADNIYGELVFKWGMANGGYQTFTINHSTIDFINFGPTPEYYVKGNATFTDAHWRIYTNEGERIILSGYGGRFELGDMDVLPILSAINNTGVGYSTPTFRHMHISQVPSPPNALVYLDSNNYDKYAYIGYLPVHVNKTDWTATITYGGKLKIHDYILTGDFKTYYDPSQDAYTPATIQVGRVIGINGNTYTLDRVSVRMPVDTTINLYLSYQ